MEAPLTLPVQEAEEIDGRCLGAYSRLCPTARPPSPGVFPRATSTLQPSPPDTSANSPKAQGCHSQNLVLAR